MQPRSSAVDSLALEDGASYAANVENILLNSEEKIVKYDASQIKLKNIPELEKLASETSCCAYLYSFDTKLPKQNDIDQIAGGLKQKFNFPKDQFEIPEDVEIFASVAIKRMEDYQAQVSILTLALCWVTLTSEWLHQLKPLTIKKHGRRAKSIFRYGFDHLRNIVLNLEQKMDAFLAVLKFLSCT